MNYEQFFARATETAMRVESEPRVNERAVPLSNEALFQIPLLAMVILILAKGQRKPAPDELGQLVGECLERAVSGFKGSPQGIGWSANLRIRTVKALTFLETAKLVDVRQRARAISVTDLGREVLTLAFRRETALAVALSTIERSYQNIAAERGIQGRLV